MGVTVPLFPHTLCKSKEDSSSAHTVVSFIAFMSVLAWGKPSLCKWERKNVSKGGEKNLLIHLWRELCIVYIHGTAYKKTSRLHQRSQWAPEVSCHASTSPNRSADGRVHGARCPSSLQCAGSPLPYDVVNEVTSPPHGTSPKAAPDGETSLAFNTLGIQHLSGFCTWAWLGWNCPKHLKDKQTILFP